MHYWSQAPLARLLLPLLAGIITAVYSGWRSSAIFLVLAGLFILLVIIHKTFSFRHTWLHGCFVAASVFFAGFGLTVLKTERYSDTHFGHHTGKSTIACVKLVSPPLEKERSLRFTAEVLAIDSNNIIIPVTGKVMLYFAKDSVSAKLRYGDMVFVSTRLNEVKPPQNPHEFDYRRYLSFHNIWHQAYVSEGSWKVQGSGHGNPVIAWSVSLRDRMLDVMRRHGVEGDEFAVGAALLLGYEDKLDQDIINAYSSTGALHVLSVSGLHVGIIYIVFNVLLNFLERLKHGRMIKAVLLLLLLWFYAALTGLSPSVLRSATMFSFIIVARATDRYSNIYNTLAASAFTLLLFDPYLIMQVGFQLSYLAVLGIVYLQPKIYALWETDNWVMDKVWAITAVSIAAQIATFPLGLHYFHQFPNYFLFSNLLVIPLSTIIIYIGILLFIFSGFDTIASWIAEVFSWLLWLLNASVKLFEYLPFAVLRGISITVAETWIIYAIIFSLLAFISLRQLYYFRLGLVMLAAFLMLQCIEAVSEHRQQKFIVYNVPGRSAYDLINGKDNVIIADTALLANDSRMLFHIRHNWWELGLDQPQQEGIPQSSRLNSDWVVQERNVISFCGQRLVVIDDDTLPAPKEKLKVSKIILARDPGVTIGKLLAVYDTDLLIIDPSNSKRRARKWKEECEKLGVKYYSVADEGAYVEEL